MTENDVLFARLTELGFTTGQSAIRDDGMLLLRINDQFMFRPDAVDLARGEATLEEIKARNAGRVFPNAPH